MKYAFLDRDGTIIFEPQDTFQVDSIDQLHILDGVIEKLVELQKQGYELVIVTNQDGLGTEANKQENFDSVQQEMLARLRKRGVEISKTLICPHYPEENCDCRKPKTGLFKDLQSIPENSIVIGDRESDIQLADNLGIKGIKLKVNQGMKGLKI